MNDSEKAIAAAAAALGLPKGATVASILKAVDAHAALAEALKGKVEEDEPKEAPAKEEPKAEELKAEEKKDEKAASVAAGPVPPQGVTLSAVPATTVAASAEEEKKAEEPKAEMSLADGPEAEMAAGKQILEALKSSTGLDAAQLVAAIVDNASAIAALLGKQPESGAPAEAPADAPPQLSAEPGQSTTVAVADGRIAALSRENEALAKKVREIEALELSRKEAARVADATRAVDAAIELGKFLDTDRDAILALALSDRAKFDAWTKTKVSAVPTGLTATAPAPERSVSTEKLTEKQSYALKQFRSAGIDEKRAIELARAKH